MLARLLAGQSLGVDEAEAVIDQILAGEATEAQIAAFVVGPAGQGRDGRGDGRASSAPCSPTPCRSRSRATLLDVVGTGGDRLGSINVSTLAAFIAAGAGARVCKHGNRAASSSVGTADVLEALGVAVDLGPAGVARCVDEAGHGLLLRPPLPPGHAPRRPRPAASSACPTVFNFLGPLANPARARYQLVGVSDPTMAEKMAGVLGANGSRRAMVVYADDGLDELSVTSPSTVLELDR